MSGCNDEGSLGRHIEDEEEETFVPGLVILPSKVKQISAGDSHTVVLTEEGQVYYWGTFRDSSGSFGLTPNGQIRNLPVHLGKTSLNWSQNRGHLFSRRKDTTIRLNLALT